MDYFELFFGNILIPHRVLMNHESLCGVTEISEGEKVRQMGLFSYSLSYDKPKVKTEDV